MSRTSLTDRIDRMPESGIREIFDLAQEYDDLADLSIGEPDMTTPKPILDAVDREMRAGATHYTPTVGRPSLREKLATKLAERNGIDVDPASELLVTPGAMGALYGAMQALVEPGDDVVVPEPYWSNYAGHVASAGGRLVPVQTDPANGFVLTPEDVERVITPETKLLVINTPSNPTGAVIPPDTLAAIGEVVAAHDCWCLVDETYETLVYDDATHHSLASDPTMFERTLTVHSFSKAYAMTGWRVGYISGPAPVVDAMRVLQEHTISCAAEPAQVAAAAALSEPALIDDIRATFERRRSLLLEKLHSVPHVSCHRPDGAFYAFVDVSALDLTSRDLTIHLLEDQQVAVVPGSVFGDAGDGYIRLSYATDEKTIENGIDRLRRGIESLA